MIRLTVTDFFCGAGGFSEGFRQQGFEIVKGYDNWKPAVDTYSHNFDKKAHLKNILDFEKSIDEITEIPNTDVIIGSPPCVSFSNSNKSGKADKSMGLRLTEVFLRIVAVKKFQKNSSLKAWFMENVPNSLKYLKDNYTFEDLRLGEWAEANRIKPDEVAIRIEGNTLIVNSAEYGSPQIRKRAITGESIKFDSLQVPARKYRSPKEKGDLPFFKTLGQIRSALPSPFNFNANAMVKDPLYGFSIPQKELSDHFYDTGLYECDWKCSRFHKVNHPFMGRMSFPEDEQKPSRTICATNIGTSRESLIYRSEFIREGNGEYRTPTVREAATLMGFPVTFQFTGSEGSKWRQVGNAVSPSVSRAFAEKVRASLNLSLVDIDVIKEANTDGITNLNDSAVKKFSKPPKKNQGSRFRRHPFKHGNITVTLSNYDIEKKTINGRWMTSVQYGNGEGYITHNYPDDYYVGLEDTIKSFENGSDFLQIINNGFSDSVAKATVLQEMYENRVSNGAYLEPTELVERIANIIDKYEFKEGSCWTLSEKVFKKGAVPKKQVMALYAINKVVSIANK